MKNVQAPKPRTGAEDMYSTRNSQRTALTAAVLASLGLAAAAPAGADETSGDWQFRVLGYAYVPNIQGTARFPASDGGADIDIAAQDLIDNTHAAAMAALEAQNGRFGGFVDLIYMSVGDSINDSPTVGAGSLPLPTGITADAKLDIEATVFTVGASYRPVASEAATLDVFAGARHLDAKTTLHWAFSAPFGPFVGPAQAGKASESGDGWDGIAGVKGEFAFGAERKWFVPFYADAGTGDSDLTWQAATGVGYRFGQFEVIGTWRTLRYEFDSNSRLEDLDMNGPAIGVSYRW
jgi:hypothetical protein